MGFSIFKTQEDSLISLQTIKGSPIDAQEYLQKGADLERYYAGKDERSDIEQGVYFGGHSLGLHAQVVGEELKYILDGKDLEGKNLYVRGRDNRRVGFDMTFSPDKSVSILWARLDEHHREKLEVSFRKAVEDTLSYTQENILSECVRRGAAGINREAPKELTWALFQHGSSRERDPQLHMHTILMNFAQRQDGSYGAVEAKELFQSQVFNLALASNLQKDLGIQIETHKDGIRVCEISRELTLKYSTRRQQIEDAADKYGITTSQAKDNLVLQTRASKNVSGTDRDLLPEWQKSFDREGFTLEKAHSLLNILNVKTEKALTPEIIEKKYVSLLEEIGKRHHPFREHELTALVAHEFTGVARLEELRGLVSAFKEDNRLVRIGHESFPDSYTTQESRNQNKRVFELGEELSSRLGHSVDQNVMKEILEGYEAQGLSLEQSQACSHILQTGDLSLLVGAAGTGKSFSLRAAKDVLEQSGYTVRGLAPTGKASRNLEQSADIPSKTVDKFLYDLARERDTFSQKDVVIIDEAAMLGNEKMKHVFEHAQALGAKIILVGDEKQLSSLDGGRPFEVLKNTLGAAEINTVRRQNHEWQRQAAQDFRQGEVRKALIAYEDRNLLTHGPSLENIKGKLVEHWIADHKREPNASQLILSSTRETAVELNLALREQLKKENLLLKTQEAKVNILEKSGKSENKAFAPGDRILFTRNDRKLAVQNGSLGTVETIERKSRGIFAFSVTLDEGKKVLFTTDKYNSVDHGYATTVHKSQGSSIDRTYVVAEKMMDKEMAYVALTRHKEECRVYAATDLIYKENLSYRDDLSTDKKIKLHIEKLTENIERSEKKTSDLNSSFEEKGERKEVVEKVCFVTHNHLQAANQLKSEDRNIVTQSLYELATKPKGVEHRYARFDFELTDYQKEAAQLLKSHDYKSENLSSLREMVESKKRGVDPTLTDKEKKTHYFKVKESVSERLIGFKYNEELGKVYLHPMQKILLENLSKEKNPWREVEILKQIALAPEAVGLEFKKSHHPFHLNESALKHLENFVPEKAQRWASGVLSERLPEGCASEIRHKKTGLDAIQESIEKLEKQRRNEITTEYSTYEHREYAQDLKSAYKLSDQLIALKGIIDKPQGIGMFGIEKPELADWQEQALSLAKGRGEEKLSEKEIDSLTERIEEAPLGKENHREPNWEGSNLSERINELIQEQKTREQELEIYLAPEREQGLLMGR